MRKGITLIEMAIVMVIIGFLVGGSIQGLSLLSKRAKVTEAKQQLQTMQEAIKGFVQTNGSLPTQAQFATLVGNNRDPWNGTIAYFHDVALETSGNICTLNTTTLASGGNFVGNDLAFMLVSGGGNYNLQTQQAGGTVNLYTPGTLIDDEPIPTNRPTDEYDDINVRTALDELKTQINCQPFEIINSALPNAKELTTYNAHIATSYPASNYAISFIFPTLALPIGITFNPISGVFSGTPSAGTANVYTFQITTTNAGGITSKRKFAITVNP
ncbi:MAG: putative Ig domain-containing protein [Sulfuricurvum sp.]